jgi:hypothetical protein
MSRSFRRMAVEYRRVADYLSVGKGHEQKAQGSQSRGLILSTIRSEATPSVADKIAWVSTDGGVPSDVLTSNCSNTGDSFVDGKFGRML